MASYFLYARKSTDTEDMQVLSIEAQLAELRALARREGLEIAEEFVEKKSAKMPGRPVFNEMMARIQKGDAQGIICWKIDRLARNPVDGGQVQWLLQSGIIAHIQTHDRAYYPADNVLMMSVEFGMANQFIRELSVNTARGLRAKARQGHFPGTAPAGYRNDPRTKTIALDRKKSKVIRAAFERYATGTKRLEDIGQFLYDNGVRSLYGNRIHNDRVKFILANPFYYGHSLYMGELHEGRHTPIVDKRLWDKVQKVMEERGHPQVAATEPQVFCGLMKCGECGMAITAEVRVKRQKNGNVHRYVYYRCTKKSAARCSQPYVREETLAADFSELLAMFVLPSEWARDFERRMEEDKHDEECTTVDAVRALREELREADKKLDRLTDLYIAQDIERDAYLSRRRALMSDKRTIQEQIERLERDGTAWLEPMQAWVKEVEMLEEIQKGPSLPAKKSALQKIFGSNLQLQNQKVSGTAHSLYAAVAAAHENSRISDPHQVWAPAVGFEPTTNALTGRCSTIELHRNKCILTEKRDAATRADAGNWAESGSSGHATRLRDRQAGACPGYQSAFYVLRLRDAERAEHLSGHAAPATRPADKVYMLISAELRNRALDLLERHVYRALDPLRGDLCRAAHVDKDAVISTEALVRLLYADARPVSEKSKHGLCYQATPLSARTSRNGSRGALYARRSIHHHSRM